MRKNFVKVVMMVAVVAMGTMMSSCSAKKSAVSVTEKAYTKQTEMPMEVEIVMPCSGLDSDAEFLRVNGTGTSKDRTMARDRAYQNALARLASKLAGVMSSENMKVGVSTNADGEEFHDKMVTISKEIAKANVSGYRTSCEKMTVTQGTQNYNCYVTIEFGKQKVVKEMYEKLSSQKLLKADYDFDRYMEMFEKDLKAYEEANK